MTRLLIVDDEAGPVRDLEARGLRVREARSKREALDALAAGETDVLAVDLDKPHLEGRQLLAALRADERTCHLPVIAFVTGKTAAERLQGLHWGADDFATRPIEPDEFAARVGVWLRIGRLRQEGASRRQALAALLGVAMSLGRSMNLKGVLEQALSQVLDLMRMDAGLICLHDDAGRGFRVSAGRGAFAADLEAVESRRLFEEFALAVAQARRPILIGDVREGPEPFAALRSLGGVLAAAGVPLLSKEQVAGTMSLFGVRPRSFSGEDEQLLMGLGHQIVVAVEKASLFEETAGALARSNLLYELSNQLHSVQNFEETVRVAAQQILEAFQADGTLISLYEAAPGTISRVGTFLDGRQGAERLVEFDPAARAIMDAGRPVLIPRASEIPGGLADALAGEGVEALLGVPVQGISGRHGALVLYYRRPRDFRPLEVETLVIYANHLGIALENARLYAAARQRAERIAAVNRLTRVISASLDIRAVYQAFAEEVKHLIPYDRMGVVLPDETGKGLRMFQLAGRGWRGMEPDSLRMTMEGTGIEWVMSRRQPHIERDLAERRLFVEDALLLKEGIRSSIRLPLIARGKVLGALFLDSQASGAFGERELELLVPLGEQLAIAIENTRLFQEINRLAITDELTGLFNHRHFYQQLEQEFKRAQRYDRPLSLIMLDIDFFKQFNDLHGHLAGDQALQTFAHRLRSNTRGVDILARYGGDEFSIILPETDLRQAWAQAMRIRSAVETEAIGGAEGSGPRLTVSLGVACLGPAMRTSQDLVRAADQALYRSKAAGGNQINLA